jgi:hypothetical protein
MLKTEFVKIELSQARGGSNIPVVIAVRTGLFLCSWMFDAVRVACPPSGPRQAGTSRCVSTPACIGPPRRRELGAPPRALAQPGPSS